MASIKWALGAKREFKEVIEYIAEDSLVYAAETGDRITSAVDRLSTFPSMGRIVPEFEDGTLRELIIGNYRLVYHLYSAKITILALVHVSRDMLKYFDEDRG